MLAEKYNNFLIISHLLGDDIWSHLGLWDSLQRWQVGLIALTGEIYVLRFFICWSFRINKTSSDNAVGFFS